MLNILKNILIENKIMFNQSGFTLINKQNGNLAFKIFSFEDASSFDHIQRLNYYSLIILTTGSGNLTADFSEYEIRGNLLLSFSPYQPFMITETNTIKGTVINFHPDFFCIFKHNNEISCNGVLFNNIYQPPFTVLPENEVKNLFDVVEQMKYELKNESLAQHEALVSFLKIFLINASRIKVSQSSAITHSDTFSEPPQIIQNLKEAIENNYRVKHSPAEYADILNVQPDALARLIKLYFNKTLTELISERIIIEAKRELYLTSKTVKLIAFELGFKDEYYFSRFFKNNTDISPSLYRTTIGFARGEVA